MTPDYQHVAVPPCRSPLHPYQPYLASSASSSSSSVFSIEVLSHLSQSSHESCHSLQSSQPSSAGSTASSWVVEHHDFKAATAPRNRENSRPACLPLRTCAAPVAPEQRQHPRRRSISNNPPPALVRQSDRKGQFVDCLVDSATQMVEVIWPLSVPVCPGEGRGVLPLRTFIQETLRRSRTSFSTLQVSLYYLILIKMHVPSCDFTMEQSEDASTFRALQCGRRMFLAALILASKYLQDRNYSARAWSKISGLKVCEINLNEIAFLRAVSWKLHIKEETFEKWQEIILQYPPQYPTSSPARWAEWRALVKRLTPDLDGVQVRSSRGSCRPQKARTWPLQQPPSPLPTEPACLTPTPSVSTSSESTPTPMSAIHLPRYLEPRPDLRPPTPARLGPLPTPNMTPQPPASSSVTGTPAVSVSSAAASRRPSMCAAMQAAQSCFITDRWANYSLLGRRPNLAPPASSSTQSGSPESMISDASSRSSRASSISSVSSAGLPNQACTLARGKLAKLATLRCAGMSNPCKDLGLISEPEIVDADSSSDDSIFAGEPTIFTEPVSSPDFQALNISDMDPAGESRPIDLMGLGRIGSPCEMTPPASPGPQLSRETSNGSNASRKRGRSSGDFHNLQQHVRDLLIPDCRAAAAAAAQGSRLWQRHGDAAAGVNAPGTVSLSNKLSVDSLRRPVLVQQDGRKRFCAQEAAETPTPPRFEGPGMWEGVL